MGMERIRRKRNRREVEVGVVVIKGRIYKVEAIRQIGGVNHYPRFALAPSFSVNHL
jgi:hypothetical protein